MVAESLPNLGTERSYTTQTAVTGYLRKSDGFKEVKTLAHLLVGSRPRPGERPWKKD